MGFADNVLFDGVAERIFMRGGGKCLWMTTACVTTAVCKMTAI